MPEPRCFALLPAARADLAGLVVAAGAVPVVDLGSDAADPGNAWVRVPVAQDAPGGGPLVVESGPPHPSRPTWIERIDGTPVPEGFAGVYLRGVGSGGRAGTADVRELVPLFRGKTPVLVDWPHPPEVTRPDVDGIVLSDVLAHFFRLPTSLARRLDRLVAADFRRVGHQNFVASLASEAHRRVAGGEPLAAVAAGLFHDDCDPFAVAWPGGSGLLHAPALGRRYPDLSALLAAYGGRRPRVEVRPPPPAPSAAPVEEVGVGRHEPVAIVGLGCRFPSSFSAAALLENLQAGFSGIIEVPRQRWDPALYWDPDKSAPDKTYAKIGGFVTGFSFNPRRFRIPPSVARLVDPIQQMALEAAADALDDAGYGEARDYDRSRVATILGNSMGGEITDEYTLRVMFPALRAALGEVPGFAALPADSRAAILAAYEVELKRDLPPITEDSMPGELANVVAGRITNALNLGGPNFTTDAACAGSMAAMQAAVKGLQDGDFDMALTGGADRSMGVATYAKFCKIGALSPDGSRPFDAGANGFVMGEGVGILVVKRLSDAIRDNDRIYAIIRGFGASSDGKGKGITAPNPEGQRRALHRAYDNAGVDPADVDLFECHGTSTVVGDKVEAEALTELVGPGRRRRPARIGSIKSNIGHLKSAAGAASAIKASLALHHRVLLPSINYRTARADIDLGVVPLQVQTRPEAWEAEKSRFCGVSSFGFGGTNFHMVLEGYQPGSLRVAARPRAANVPAPNFLPAAPASPASVAAATERFPVASVPVPQGLWALSADTPEELIERCTALVERGEMAPYEPSAPLRVAAAAADDAERASQVEKVIAAVRKGKGYDLVRQRGIALEDVPSDGQLAFVFTGQGSQYIDMGLDLAEKYPLVADTFREADEVMAPLLGRPLTSFIRRDASLTEDEQFEALRDTAISQPATLTVDIAILRLLSAWGVRPDMVAGHSLGEYGAAVAAGILSFRDALLAVSARGREMAAVKLDDFGKMAGIAAGADVVMEVLAEVPGYVVPANKNSPGQTVIAGDSDAVEAASELFKSRGITVYPLPVSHAFHSRIVAPASAPLKRVLERLDIHEPRRKITTNVDSRYYPTGPGAREAIIDNLARQVAAPVEWIAQVERMYNDGARIFVECGPKRALSGFVVAILKHRPHRALYTNQPKRGGVLSFLDALAELYALGFPVAPAPARSTDLFADAEPRRSTTAALAAHHAAPSSAPGRLVSTPEVQREIMAIVSHRTGIPVEALALDQDVEADLGIDTVKLADIIGQVRERLRLDPDPDFRMGQHRTLQQLTDYAARRLGSTRPASVPERRAAHATPAPAPVFDGVPSYGAPVLPADSAARFLAEIAGSGAGQLDGPAFAHAMLPALQGFLGAAWTAFQQANASASARVVPEAPRPLAVPTSAPPAPSTRSSASASELRVVCTGASVGLPGGTEVFEPDGLQRMLRGENRITAVSEANQDRFVAKNLVRLTKDPVTGEGSFLGVSSRDQVIRLAGQKAHFDLVADYGVDAGLARSLDITTQLAFAAALEARRDARIPLVRTFRKTTTGKDVATGWGLPESLRDTTGIIFASAFPGYDQLVRKLSENADDGEGHFDRRFLFQVLAMGHSQLAQFLGARGPNTQLNAACASTTQAIAVAEDWLRAGRCERVIVVGADDVTSEALLEWIGAGFMAAGAATTKDKVEEAALPFDRRRHGMILGMGACGLVLETTAAAEARGIVPIAELLGAHIANSAFHGTRLDAEHISREVKTLVDRAVTRAGVSHDAFASACVFLSHETYTPARGGSAAAEMASLPHAFGPAASRIVVANTKGFTGHPMGAGIEDTVAVKALQYQQVPPIPNLREPDPDLGNLTLSKGGHYDVKYALRLAAGFGSQLALAAWKKVAHGDERVANASRHEAWLTASGGGPGTLVVEHRQLRLVVDRTVVATAAPVEPARTPATTAPSGGQGASVSRQEVLDRLLGVIAAKTGYGREEVDPSYELEADLGIDTVKQAEIFAEVRDAYGLGRDDNFKLADYPTVEKLAGWMADRVGADAGAAVAPGAPEPPPAPPDGSSAPGRDDVLAKLVAVVAAKTGYDPSEIDPGYELEADLGIDTVKQAEIFAEVRDAYGLGRDDNFKLADYPTVEKLAGWMAERVAASPPARPSGEPVAKAPPAATSPATTPGHDDAPAPVDDASTPGDNDAPAAVDVATVPAPADPGALPDDFRVRRVLRVSHVQLPVSTLRGQVVWVLGGGDLATALRDEVHAAGARMEGKPDVVIDCGLPVEEAFLQAKRLDGERPRQWLCVLAPATDLLGARDGGARAGLCKALGREWPACKARVVTLAPGWNVVEAARGVVDELGEADRAVESWIGPGQREVAALAVEPVPTDGQWPAHPVVLLTGGTRGITAEVAREIARRGPCTLWLLARSAPADAPLDEAVARERIKDMLSAAGKRVTPKLVEDGLRPLRVAEEARANVAALVELGATVEVYAIDLADVDAVRGLCDDLRAKHPRLDLVVHGAGVEESRLLPDKDEAAFRRVFDGKARGGLALAQALDPATFFVSMGSIAGRFGNAGQVDYAAANEAMAQVCQLRPRSLHVAWTAWGGVGMAVRGGMEQLLTARGVELLPPEAGSRLLCELVAAGVTGEVVVAGGLGDFQAPALHPFLDTVELVGDRARARRRMSVATDEWIVDHAIDGVPVLPGVIGLELMIAAALAANPRGRYCGCEDVTFSAPLKVHRDDAVDIEVNAHPDGDDGYDVTLRSSRVLKNGRIATTEHFSARIQLAEMPLLSALPPSFFPEERLAQKEIYRRFFHGPRFQVLRAAEAIAVGGLMAEAAVEHAPIAEGLVSDPLVLEAAFQAAGLHRMVIDGVMALPSAIDAVELVRPVVEGDPLNVLVSRRGGAYDIDVDGAEGRVMRVRGFRMVEKGPLDEGARFVPPEGGWPSTGTAEAAEARDRLPADETEALTGRGTAKRQADRLAGQLAANRAVAALAPGLAFTVAREASGQPVVRGAVDVEVSITHVDGEALAVAVHGAHVGTDMEPVAPRGESFVQTWFTEGERAWATDDTARTAVWAIKEAVLKALGKGMALSPLDVDVLDPGGANWSRAGGTLSVHLTGEAAAAHVALGGAPLRVRVGRLDGRVVATVVFAA